MDEKRLLIVSLYFAPSAAVGAKRATRLALRVREYGWSPFVLTVGEGCCPPIEPSTPLAGRPDVHVERVSCLSPWWHSEHWSAMAGRWRRFFWRANRIWTKPTWRLLPAESLTPWVWRATSRGVSLVKKHKIDMIWATAPTLASLVVAQRISQRTGVPYVVDFRDVRNVLDTAGLRWHERRVFALEKRVVEHAAGISYVAPDQVSMLHRMYPGSRQKPHCLVYNWFEQAESDALPVKTFDRPTMLYGGTLYGGTRRVDGLMQAMALREQRKGPESTGLQLVLHCPLADRPNLARAISQFRLGEAIRMEDMIPQSEFQSASRGADILLVVAGHTIGAEEHAKAPTGKLFDYMAAGRPILVIGPKECFAGQMVERLNRGLSAPDDHPEEIAKAIDLLLAGQGRQGPLDLSPEAVSEFEGAKAVARLAEFLRRCLPH